MKKVLMLRAVQTLKGNDAATAEILRALRKTKGNMREACALLDVGKSSMYRLIKDLGCADAVEKLVRELEAKTQRKVQSTAPATTDRGPRWRVKRVVAA